MKKLKLDKFFVGKPYLRTTSVTCHMRSHNNIVTCHPTQAHTPITPDLHTPDGWKAELT